MGAARLRHMAVAARWLLPYSTTATVFAMHLLLLIVWPCRFDSEQSSYDLRMAAQPVIRTGLRCYCFSFPLVEWEHGRADWERADGNR